MRPNTLEEFLKRRQKRTAMITSKTINRELIKTAVINTIQPFFSKNEIIDIDIPALTTELVDIKIYTKETEGRGPKQKLQERDGL